MSRIWEFNGTDRFQVLSQLGRGGMGVVYHVLDRERNTRLALKLLRNLEADALIRFKREFRLLQDLQHPNLINLGELIEDEGQWFFTMELVHGVDFITFVRRHTRDPGFSETHSGHAPRRQRAESDAKPPLQSGQSLPWNQTNRFDERRLRSALAQLAQGVCALHNVGKIHRDIKPSNILVTQEGRVVILDFGLITSIGSEHESTGMGVIGTHDYMAPEQATSDLVGPEADWYGVGTVLYQALTGDTPFTGYGLQVLVNKQRETPPPPSAMADGVPKDLNALCVRLLSRNPDDRPSDNEVLSVLGIVPRIATDIPSQPDRSQPPALVGRKPELQTLNDAFEFTLQQRPVALIVRGESGVGKTALLRHFAEEVARKHPEAVILSGRCYQQESVPFKAFDGIADQLARWMNSFRVGEVEKFLPRNSALLAKAFPVLRRVDAIADAPQPVAEIRDPQELRSRVFTAVRELFGRISERHPVIVVIDDLQWSDGDSLAMLSELTRPPESPPILLLTTMRGGEENIQPTDLKFLTTGDGLSLRLGALPLNEAKELSLRLLSNKVENAEERADAIALESKGHPLFIDTLVRYQQTHDTPAENIRLDDALWEQITTLDPAERHLLEIVALAGFPISQQIAAAASEMDPSLLAIRIKSLRIASLLRTSGPHLTDNVEPYHDRVRETIEEKLDLRLKRKHHHRVARALEGYGQGDAVKLVLHWSQANQPEKAASYALIAAEKATEALAFDRAAEFYHLAMQYGPPKKTNERELFIRLGESFSNAGRGFEAAAAFRCAIEGSNAADALDLQRRVAEHLLVTGYFDEGVEALRQLFHFMGIRYPKTPRRVFFNLVLLRAWIRIRGLRFRLRDSTRITQAELSHIDTYWAAMKGLSGIDPLLAQVFQARGLLLALKSGEPYRITRSIAMEIVSRAVERPRARARTDEIANRAQRLAMETDQPHALAMVLLSRGMATFLTGDFRASLELSQGAEEILRNECAGAAWEVANVVHIELTSLVWLGEWREFCRRAPRACQEAQERGDLYTETYLRSGLVTFAHLIDDKPENARDEDRRTILEWSHQGFHMQHVVHLRSQTLIELYERNFDRALERVSEAWEQMERSMMIRVQFVRIITCHLRGVTYLSCASTEKAEKKGILLTQASQCARQLQLESTEWAHPIAWLIEAGVAAQKGHFRVALDLYTRAESGLQKHGVSGFAMIARRRRGQVLGKLFGGDKGCALINQADDWMTGQGVQNPVLISEIFAGVFPE